MSKASQVLLTKKKKKKKKLYVFNTVYIGLFDRSLLHMLLNQVELVLKNATSKSRTPVSMYQFDPI